MVGNVGRVVMVPAFPASPPRRRTSLGRSDRERKRESAGMNKESGEKRKTMSKQAILKRRSKSPSCICCRASLSTPYCPSDSTATSGTDAVGGESESCEVNDGKEGVATSVRRSGQRDGFRRSCSLTCVGEKGLVSCGSRVGEIPPEG